jgi:nitrogen fixation/metabolism regulation signal transduction histidine kinase
MEARRMKRFLSTVLITSAVLLGVAALLLLSQTAQDSEQFGRLHDLLLLVNAAGAVILLVLIIGNLFRLLRDFIRKVPGTRLKARLLIAIVGLSVAPVIVVYMFAVQVLNRGIDSWFDIEIESGLRDALTLSRSALDRRIQLGMENTQLMAVELIRNGGGEDLLTTLNQLRRETGATEITLFNRNLLILATSHNEAFAPFPVPPPEDVILQLRQAGTYVGVDPVTQGHYQVRAALVLPSARLDAQELTLQALYPVPERIGTLVDSVESTFTNYNELVFLRKPLMTSSALTLTLVVMLAMLAAVYGAFFFARRLVAPVLSVVSGTHAVAKGNFDTRLPVTTHDEIGFLIDSFNQMIQRLGAAREEARLTGAKLEKERANVEAILARLSTGVVALESDGRILNSNAAAATILNVDLMEYAGTPLGKLAAEFPALTEFIDAWRTSVESGQTEWRKRVALRGESGKRELVCASSALPAEGVEPGGSVIVLDDITELLQAQRDAAWGEVARRLAHEIKNPLTPIQLSAERIRRRYLGSMKDMEAEVLDRATHTIVAQVEAMRDMVNAFSEYARAPAISISRFELNQLVREVAYLYRATGTQPGVQLNLDDMLQDVYADDVRLRQLLHNLIRNSMEATEGLPEARVEIATRVTEVAGKPFAEIRVADNGPGIDAAALENLFDPYVTTKSKGTGLGLAIVKKLVEEHGGTVSAENRESGGARITVRLPIGESPKDSGTDSTSRSGDHRRKRA